MAHTPLNRSNEFNRQRASAMFAAIETIVPSSAQFSHDEAMRVSKLAIAKSAAKWIVVDLKNAAEATTTAFARLVLLRRQLLSSGRDLTLAELSGRAESLYHINRLEDVLPRT
jgi:hypothetical protein